MSATRSVSFAPLALAERQTEIVRQPDGIVRLHSSQPLAPYATRVGDYLRQWTRQAPDRVFLAERDRLGDWQRWTYREVAETVERLAAGLLRTSSRAGAVMILSGNSVRHALITLAAMEIGWPAAPISTAYSLMSRDFGRLLYVFEALQPAVVFVEQEAPFQPALDRLSIPESRTVVGEAEPTRGIPFETLLEPVPPSAQLAEARHGVEADSVAKLLFTSGSTGLPKGVINTQRMLCSNQQAIAQLWPFVESRPPVIVDWLPWSHTFGANHNFNLVLRNGGTLYIDEGKPAPGLIEKTIANLRQVPSTVYFNVPRGFDMLIPQLETDTQLRETFFSELQAIFYAGAALPQNLWDGLERLAISARGVRIPLLSAWGATETAPLATSVHFLNEAARVIGLPAPGVELKLVPTGSKLEVRVKGPNVSPGYLGDELLTAKAFDEEGFFRTGDAVRLADEADPNAGLLFDGRTAENFKLNSGTWVHVGELRLAAIAAAAPLLADAVVCGHDRDEVGILGFPNLAACQEVGDAEDPFSQPQLRAQIARALRRHNDANQGSSERITRFLWLEEPPSIDANEITDKGYINQAAVLERRTRSVEQLYSDAAEVVQPDLEGG